MLEPLLIGTGNKGKAAELAELLHGLDWAVRSLADYPAIASPVEDGETFEANALVKAEYFCRQFDVACVADDSGLVVDALNGAPGVLSARYSGEGATDASNNAKLLAELASVPWDKRTARFVCCVAFVRPGGLPHTEFGIAEGRIGFEPRGRNGFGYDPLFFPEGYDRTFGQMTHDEKRRISHRGRALQKLRAYFDTLRSAS